MFVIRSLRRTYLKNTNKISRRSIGSMGKPRILLTRPDIPAAGMDLLRSKCDIVSWNANSAAPREFVLENILNKDGIYCFLSDKIDVEALNAAGPNLKVVSTFSVGYDHIDVVECKKRGIRIGYTPDVLTEATAELTMGLLLCTSRRLIEAHKEATTGGWTTWAPTWMIGPGLKSSTVGIVGFGRIGQSVARKVKAFNVADILYYNRTEKIKEASEIGATNVTFEDLLEKSDFVICCLALTKETTHIFNAESFDKMKKSAIFINSSRGDLVHQESLIDALTHNKIRAAGLDVTSPEPLPLDSPLFKLKNCVVLPHIGSATIEARTTMSKLTAENLIAGLENRKMPAELIL